MSVPNERPLSNAGPTEPRSHMSLGDPLPGLERGKTEDAQRRPFTLFASLRPWPT
jgi:hypothetical protein